jgi:Domain of unknown function (DUF4184)
MPFTFAHAAAGLPFRRFQLAWPAFFIGSFAPDFEYFLRLAPQTAYGHHWPGVALFTLPAACAALILYELFVREMLVSLLPTGLQKKTPPPQRKFGLNQMALIFFSLILGIATHIFWDGFTHDNTWATALWPALLHPVRVPGLGARTIAHLLQWASSVLGMLAVVWWGRSWYLHAEPVFPVRAPQPHRLRSVTTRAAMVALGVSVLRALMFTGDPIDDHSIRKFCILVIVDVIGLLWWFLLAAGVVRRFALRTATVERS